MAADDAERVATDPLGFAREIALRQLAAAPRTRAQLEQALTKRDVPSAVQVELLDRLTDVALIDDTAFARAWVDSRHLGRGLASRALAHELRQRGVADDVIKDAVAVVDLDAEQQRARELVRARLASTARLDPQRRTRRLAGMLARKGYPAGVAFAAVREELATEGQDVPDVLPEEVDDELG